MNTALISVFKHESETKYPYTLYATASETSPWAWTESYGPGGEKVDSFGFLKLARRLVGDHEQHVAMGDLSDALVDAMASDLATKFTDIDELIECNMIET